MIKDLKMKSSCIIHRGLKSSENLDTKRRDTQRRGRGPEKMEARIGVTARCQGMSTATRRGREALGKFLWRQPDPSNSLILGLPVSITEKINFCCLEILSI